MSELLYYSLLETLLMCTVLTIVLLVVLRKKLIIPIEQLSSASVAISDGYLEQKIVISRGTGELQTLTKNFTNMRDSIKDTFRSLSEQNNDLEEAHRNVDKFRNYLENVLNAMPSQLICIDENHTIQLWNNEATKSLVTSDTNIKDRNIYDVFPELFEQKSMIDNATQILELQTAINVKRLIDNEEFYFDYIVYPLISDDIKGAVIRVDNVTKRVQMESVIVQSEKMRSVAGLAAGMAHEINNPLAVITQGIQNILRRLDPSLPKNISAAAVHDIDLDKLNKFLIERKIITFLEGGREAVTRAAQIVKNMLLFARKTDSSLVMTNLAQLIDHTIELGSTDYDMKKKYDFKFIDIIKDYDPQTPPTMCCASEIEQVLLNLLKNSIQAMEEIETEGYKPQFHVRLIREKIYIRIEIEDNGPGIPKEVQSRVFEPFFTTKELGVGTGLGLSVSYMIITQNHGGTFAVESLNGQGTKFIIRLPLLT